MPTTRPAQSTTVPAAPEPSPVARVETPAPPQIGEDGGLSTVAIVGIVLAVVLVLGGGAAYFIVAGSKGREV